MLLKEINKSFTLAFSGPKRIRHTKRLFQRGTCALVGTLLRRRPSNILLLIHSGRCGSTVIGQILDQQPSIYWDAEILTKITLNGGHQAKKVFSNPALRKQIYKKRCLRANGKPFGFEMKYSQFGFTNSSLAKELALLPEGVPVALVFLDRENPVRRLLSSALANRTGQYHGTFTDRSQFHVNIDDPGGWGKSVLELLNENENPRVRVLQEAAQLFGDTVTHFSYEKDVESNPSRAAETIFRLMHSGDEFQPVEVRRRDIHRKPLNELVVNFQELEKHLENTSFKKYLYE
jgi:hypothetical protein